jgi:hypothetical protein
MGKGRKVQGRSKREEIDIHESIEREVNEEGHKKRKEGRWKERKKKVNIENYLTGNIITCLETSNSLFLLHIIAG